MIQKKDGKQDFLNKQRFYNRLFENEDHYGVKEYWHGWAGNFHRYRIKILRNIFINTLRSQKNTQILDIGSGISTFKEVFRQEECPQVTAFDISTVLIQKAKKICPHIKSIVDDAQNPSITGKWDILFAGEIIEHLPRPKEALLKWNDLLKEGGWLVVSTPNRHFSQKTEEHISLFAINEMKKMLSQLDFKIIEIIGIDIFNPLLDHFLNKIAKYIPKISGISDRIFQTKMKLAFRLPWLARDIVYVAKKRFGMGLSKNKNVINN
jgi:2-polyprenyl-3-methyl-5-hydroxy-6-metoxy-1,4-benzoquinol methylase